MHRTSCMWQHSAERKHRAPNAAEPTPLEVTSADASRSSSAASSPLATPAARDRLSYLEIAKPEEHVSATPDAVQEVFAALRTMASIVGGRAAGGPWSRGACRGRGGRRCRGRCRGGQRHRRRPLLRCAGPLLSCGVRVCSAACCAAPSIKDYMRCPGCARCNVAVHS
jgi:hypothetical protein